MRIRTVKTSSGKYAVQVVSKKHGKLTVHKHIGSYKTESEKSLLLSQATAFIENHDTIQQDLFEKQLPFPIFMPFLYSNLIDPNHISSPYGLPIDFCTNIAVNNTHDRLITHILLYANILYCAIYE
jgi:hypothetical protein